MMPFHTDYADAADCPVRNVLDRIGDQWSVLVLWSLSDGTLRFTEIKRRVRDISQRMLAQTLRRLEEDGFVSRHAYPTVPPKVEYALTDTGRSFLEPMGALVEWAMVNHASIRASRAAYVPPATA